MSARPFEDDGALEIARQLDRMIEELEAEPQEPMLARTRELARLLNELHGSGLARILSVLRAHHPDALEGLLEDDVVASLLVLHDLHPEPARVRVERALARLERTIRLRLALLDCGPRVARVRCEGGHTPAGAASREIERMIGDAVQAMAPEIEHVEVEGLSQTTELVQISLARTPLSAERTS